MSPKICVQLWHEDPLFQTTMRLLLNQTDDVIYGGEVTSADFQQKDPVDGPHVLMIGGGCCRRQS